MSTSIVIRVLKKGDTAAIIEARANVQVEHTIEFEGDSNGCTTDTSAFEAGVNFFPDAYVIVGVGKKT